MMQCNYCVLPSVKVNHDFTSNSPLNFQFHFSEVHNIKKKKISPVNITHLLFLHGVME